MVWRSWGGEQVDYGVLDQIESPLPSGGSRFIKGGRGREGEQTRLSSKFWNGVKHGG